LKYMIQKKDWKTLFSTSVIIKRGTIKKGDHVVASIDGSKRNATERNHTATHLLHKALQLVLGDHVRQAGSLVSPEKLRFDFTHFEPIPKSDLVQIEKIVYSQILENLKVTKTYMPIEDAIKSGAMALFGEKYEKVVRVIEVEGFSRELCGGCHVRNLGELGFFKIVSETSVASGVRRIEAVTGMGAFEYINNYEGIIDELAQILRINPEQLPSKVTEILEENKNLKKEIEATKYKDILSVVKDIDDKVKIINGIKVVGMKLDNVDTNLLRELMDGIKNKLKSAVVLLVSTGDNKLTFFAGVTKDLTNRFSADKIVKEVAKVTGGGGGGRPDFAQAGGKDISKLDLALETFERLISQ